jgi:hypothetical protein
MMDSALLDGVDPVRVLCITSGFVTSLEIVLAELNTWAFRILHEAMSVAGQTRRRVCSLHHKGQRTSAFNGNGPGGGGGHDH